jgi:hypothetical protein
MALLSNLLLSRAAGTAVGDETNISTGTVVFFSNNSSNGTNAPYFCWKSPITGTAVIEVWGAGGSTPRGCCCGIGIPGNAGAYSKKVIAVNTSTYICGCAGTACGNGAMCTRGCSDPSGATWYNAVGLANGCVCAQGGKGGYWICSTNSSPFCCFYANSFCGTLVPDNCGIICNHSSGHWIPCGYGGDVNCCGMVSCASFFGCYPNQPCCYQYHIATPPNYASNDGTIITIQGECSVTGASATSTLMGTLLYGISAASKRPTHGVPWQACYASHSFCGCYEDNGCIPYLPTGVGAPPPHVNYEVRDQGYRGGMGGVRIRFY